MKKLSTVTGAVMQHILCETFLKVTSFQTKLNPLMSREALCGPLRLWWGEGLQY